jgi:hypothetical protein
MLPPPEAVDAVIEPIAVVITVGKVAVAVDVVKLNSLP